MWGWWTVVKTMLNVILFVDLTRNASNKFGIWGTKVPSVYPATCGLSREADLIYLILISSIIKCS